MMKGQTQFDGITGEVNAGPCALHSRPSCRSYIANIHLHVKPTHPSLITARQNKDKTLTALVTQETAVQATQCGWKQNSE